MAGFHKRSEELIYQGRIITLGAGTFVTPEGDEIQREVVHHPGAVSVVPLLDDGRVVLVRQYRAPLEDDLLEIPAGKRDVDGEPVEVTANRELAEEVGLHARTLVKLVEFHNSAGFTDEHSFVFLGTDLVAAELDLQGPEEQHMSIERVPFDDALAMIDRGEITDAKTIIGLLLTRARRGS